MSAYRIGEISSMLGLSIDTLRYYEDIRLLPHVARNPSGLRVYNDKDVARLKFIRRAQTINFTLKEIGQLLKMREDPQHARNEVRELTRHKLSAIEERLDELNILRKELQLLVNLCEGSEDGCPIIEEINQEGPTEQRRNKSVAPG